MCMIVVLINAIETPVSIYRIVYLFFFLGYTISFQVWSEIELEALHNIKSNFSSKSTIYNYVYAPKPAA